MLKIRRPLGRLIFNMGIAIPGKTVFLIETAPRAHMGRTANIIIKYIIHIFSSISKKVCILLMGQRYLEHWYGITGSPWSNSLHSMRLEWNFRSVNFKLILIIDCWGIFHGIALRWMSLDLIDDKSTLVQVMASCHHATTRFLCQCYVDPVLCRNMAALGHNELILKRSNQERIM